MSVSWFQKKLGLPAYCPSENETFADSKVNESETCCRGLQTLSLLSMAEYRSVTFICSLISVVASPLLK